MTGKAISQWLQEVQGPRGRLHGDAAKPSLLLGSYLSYSDPPLLPGWPRPPRGYTGQTPDDMYFVPLERVSEGDAFALSHS